MSVLIVGELNPYGADPFFALYHLPRGASGDNLRRHLGLKDVQYERIKKINLCCDKWSMKAAREVASACLANGNIDTIIMLGTKVKKAFGSKLAFFDYSGSADILQRRVNPVLVSLPHPSGLNRLWNQPNARQRAQALLKTVCPSIYDE